MASKRHENPARLTRFLEREAVALKNHWLHLTEEALGEAHPDIGWYAVRFPKSPWTHFKTEGIDVADYPSYVPFASLYDTEAGVMSAFLAIDATHPACPVFVWDAMNGEGFFPVTKS